jgi:hypothetical protein
MRSVQFVAAAAVLSFGHVGAALADVTQVFEWREASGVLSFSQEPPPPGTKGVTVRVMATASLSPAQRLAIQLRLAGLDAAQQADAKRFEDRTAAADRTVDLALQRLSSAEQAVRSGRTPLTGDRIGNAGGGTRLRTTYFDRQKELEASAQDARTAVEQAYRARADLTP